MIVSCNECNGKVSTEASACPHCGAPRTSEGWSSIAEQNPRAESETQVERPKKPARGKFLGRLRSVGGRLVGRSRAGASTSLHARKTDRERSQREEWRQKALFWFWVWFLVPLFSFGLFILFAVIMVSGDAQKNSNLFALGFGLFLAHAVIFTPILSLIIGFAFFRMIYCLCKK